MACARGRAEHDDEACIVSPFDRPGAERAPRDRADGGRLDEARVAGGGQLICDGLPGLIIVDGGSWSLQRYADAPSEDGSTQTPTNLSF